MGFPEADRKAALVERMRSAALACDGVSSTLRHAAREVEESGRASDATVAAVHAAAEKLRDLWVEVGQ